MFLVHDFRSEDREKLLQLLYHDCLLARSRAGKADHAPAGRPLQAVLDPAKRAHTGSPAWYDFTSDA
jgi:hypothetical protein